MLHHALDESEWGEHMKLSNRVGQIVATALSLILLSGGGTAATAQTLTALYPFSGPPDGKNSVAALIADASGALYGTTETGGSGTGCGGGCGTVFKLTPPPKTGGPWIESVLYSFTNSPDGALPQASLIADASGALYGTTTSGGTGCSSGACGTVFKLTPPPKTGGPWTENVLYSFTGGSDGGIPLGSLFADASGALYGTTEVGGSGGGGTVFKLTPPTPPATTWTVSVLYSFAGGSDGANPQAGVIADTSGALYSTTLQGGVSGGCAGRGCGTVFKLTPPTPPATTWTESVLYIFTDVPDGSLPQAGLIIADASGALYGTTAFGGTGSACGGIGCGTVFKLTPPTPPATTWTETVLYNFTGGSDGAAPVAGLIADASGALYGTTQGGGIGCTGNPVPGCGTVFKLTPPTPPATTWTVSVLYNFTGGSDGAVPDAGLIADASGALYSTTANDGGTGCSGSGCGTVFKLQLPAIFQGVPGQANCVGQSISFLAKTHGGIAAAAAALQFASVQDFQNAITSFCTT